MDNARIEALRKMLEKNPSDARAHFGLAAEYEKAGDWERVVTELKAYLSTSEDQGNAWGRLGSALRQLGRADEAQAAYARGADAAARHGHPTMAMEFEELLENWE
jgi:predicted Zn-dependent protease